MSDYVAPAFGVILPNIGGIAGGFITKGAMTWYHSLRLPWFKPPSKVFGPVWTGLYCSMGYASYMVWRDGGGFGGDAAMPLAWYGAQMALNWGWTPIFFGLKSPKWALAEGICMWMAIAGTIYNFSFVNETAAKVLLPYLGWVSFANILTCKIWLDNRDEKKAVKDH